MTCLPGFVPNSKVAREHQITVVTWNIAWAYGWGSSGTGNARPESHFRQTLAEMGRALQAWNPDIILLQEVDFHCTRSHYIDQAEFLARSTRLPFIAKGTSWRANWVPFPYWPPANHFGEMLSGGAILSRYPITEHTIETVDKPTDHPWLYRWFYPFRYHQKAILKTPMGPILVYNVHTEAFHQENRILHAKQLANRLIFELLPLSIVGGDLNTVLPEASMRSNYPDEPETDHQSDPTLEIIRSIPGLLDPISGEKYIHNEQAWMTFPSHAPNRKLDYLFHTTGLTTEQMYVPRATALDLSDHLPIVAQLKPLKVNS
ncbi:MAG: endonuclease/exonuclease/phosphatase family protein [Myxococcales bacterium]|nr:endonuclease/exonuclease/phosphatase family protein [Myxococcales bacterium]